MQALLAPLRELAEYDQVREDIRKGRTPVALSGCVDSQKLHMVYGLSDGIRFKVIVTYSDLKARELYEEYRFYDRNALLYPAKDLIFFQADIHGNQLTRERVRVLRRIAEGKPLTLITTFAALMTPQVQWNPQEDILTVENGGTLDAAQFARRLVDLGYEKAPQVESSGQFSVRGGIIDVFELTEDNPYRIELWGDQVESLRSFDVLSQRSLEKLESVTIYPAAEFVMSRERLEAGVRRIEADAAVQEKKLREAFETEAAHRVRTQLEELKEQLLEFQVRVNLESYIRYFYEDTVTLPELLQRMERQSSGNNLIFFLDEPTRIAEHADAVELEFRESMGQRAQKGYVLPGQMDILYGKDQVMARCLASAVVSLATMDGKNSLIKPISRIMVSARNVSSYNNSFDALVKDLTRYRKQGYRVLLLSGSRTRASRLAEDLRDFELSAVYTEDPLREVQPGEILTYYGHVNKGFEYPLIKYVVIAESDIFGAEKKEKQKALSGSENQRFP